MLVAITRGVRNIPGTHHFIYCVNLFMSETSFTRSSPALESNLSDIWPTFPCSQYGFYLENTVKPAATVIWLLCSYSKRHF